jgi:2-oxoglutarate dehydrogenase E2 component (dihydrolipoamide succinyltransferase)
VNHAPGGQRCERKRGSHCRIDIPRNDAHVRRRNDQKLGGRARKVLSENPVLQAERMLAGLAETACAIADAGIHDDVVAGGDRRDVGSCRVHHATCIRRNDPRRCDGRTGKAREHEEIEMIERGAAHADTHIRRGAQCWCRKVFPDLELLESAVPRDDQASHAVECIFATAMTSIKVPPLGESIVEATVSRWLKNEGDPVAPGDTLVELETDKITVEVPSITGGVLTKRLVKEGDVVKLDQLLAEIDEKAAPAAAGAPKGAAAAASSAAQPDVPAARPAAAPQSPTGAAPKDGGADGQRVSPAAQRTAAERGTDVATVRGTGRGGVISKADVLEAPAATPARQSPAPARQAPAPTPTPGRGAAGERETREKMTTRRKRIAENLLQSHVSTARLTTFNEIDMTSVESIRARVKEKIEKEHGVRLSFMPFFVKATCMALRQYPVVNAQVDGDSIVYHHYVNMGIAVASEAGLVVPTIKDADRKGMLEVARDIADVARRGRDGKLTMDDLTGGTFTITNGGVFGSLVSTPILNYPQVGILGLHKIQERPVAVNGKVEIRPMMYVALSYDHRIIDGQQAVLFLVRIKELMEDPALLAID